MDEVDQQTQQVEISILSQDNNEIKLKIDGADRMEITCANLLAKVEEMLNISTTVSIYKIFSLYLVSKYLELPMKDNYKPFGILVSWSDLLKTFAPKFHHLKKDDIDQDQPVISLQRNMLLERSDEEMIEDELVLKLLYEEAKSNVINGRYQVDEEEHLSAIQLKVDYLRANDEIILTTQYFRENVDQYLSRHYLQSTTGSFLTLNRPRASGLNLDEKVNNILKSDDLNLSLKGLYKEYLRRCRQLVYYGSVFYHGQTERVPSMFKSLIRNKDLKILIAINYEGIHFIDQKTSKLLDSLGYDDFQWELAVPRNINENPNALPCLFIKLNDESNQDLSKITQIFSKQAKLMDNTLRLFDERLRLNISQDMVDSYSRSFSLMSSKSNKKSLNFCSCAKFDKNGVCVKEQGSFKLAKRILK